jgi:putative oxygen-independent coproporphyrinogen III oxidase
VTAPPGGDRGWLERPLESGPAAGFGVYLHVPFCHHRCGYCDFATEAVGGLPDDERADVMRRYVAALRADLAAQAAARAWPRVTSVFVGGGTPTLLPPELLAEVVGAVGEHLELAPDAEITVECNPETASEATFAALVAAGADRVSMGAQSFDPGVLAVLERRHRPERTAAAVAQARAAGIRRVSLDLIYGTPGEDAASWRDGLAAVIALDVDHVSAYALGVHANTPLGRAVAAGTVPAPDDDVQRDRYDEARAVLAAAGYVQYEVANLARGDAERSRHNVLYWRHGDYLGVGVGAHAHVDGRRWWTTRSTERYLAAHAPGAAAVRDADGRVPDLTGEEVLDDDARALERLLLGLRLREGLHPRDVPPLDPVAVEDAVAAGLVTGSCGRLQATEDGWFLLDEAVARLLGDGPSRATARPAAAPGAASGGDAAVAERAPDQSRVAG